MGPALTIAIAIFLLDKHTPRAHIAKPVQHMRVSGQPVPVPRGQIPDNRLP